MHSIIIILLDYCHDYKFIKIIIKKYTCIKNIVPINDLMKYLIEANYISSIKMRDYYLITAM